MCEKCSFVQNNATQGPVAAIFGEMALVLDNCEISQNIAQIGEDIGMIPKRIEMKIYKTREELLFSKMGFDKLIMDKYTVNSILCLLIVF